MTIATILGSYLFCDPTSVDDNACREQTRKDYRSADTGKIGQTVFIALANTH